MPRLAALILAALLAACGDGGGGATPARPATIEKTTADGRVVVRISPGATRFPVNEHFTLSVVVVSADTGRPLDILVAIDADMPEHKHGMNVKPVLEKTGPGAYAAKGMLLHMLGKWEIETTLLTPSGATERLLFPLMLED